MRKIVVANRKGGVAKTTTAVHLAAALSMADFKVLLIDTDSQGHCSKYFEVDPEYGLSDVIEGNVPAKQAIVEVWESLSFLAGGGDLVGTQRLIAREMPHKAPHMMKESLTPIEGQYDFVIIDTAPGYNELTVNVLFYAGEILIPVSMEALAVSGFAAFMREVDDVKEYTDLEVKYIVPTFVDGRVKKSEAILDQLKDAFGNMVTLPIGYNVSLSEAPAWGKTVYDYAPKGRGALDYAKLAGIVAR